MAESTLTIGLPELRTSVGFFLGYGRTYASMSADQQANVDAAIKAGIRAFYFPPPLPGLDEDRAHQWSFIHITTTLDTVASTSTVQLPDNFGSLEWGFMFANDENYSHKVDVVTEQMVMRQFAGEGTEIDVPRICAVRSKSSTGAAGQKNEAIFWPTPNAAYTLYYKYLVLMDALSDSYPYPLGGMKYSGLIESFCIWQADVQINGNSSGPTYEHAMRLLAAGISSDKKGNNPKIIGYMGDNSDCVQGFGLRRSDVYATYNGVLYED